MYSLPSALRLSTTGSPAALRMALILSNVAMSSASLIGAIGGSWGMSCVGATGCSGWIPGSVPSGSTPAGS